MSEHIRYREGSLDEIGVAGPLDEDADALVLLPSSSEDGRHVFATASTPVEAVLKENSVAVARIQVDGQVLFRDERAFTWLGPVLFVGTALYSDNPKIVAVALSAIANYVSDLFKGRKEDSRAKLEIVTQTKAPGRYRRISYDGPVSGLQELAKIVDSTKGRYE